ncbi:helix-turn-helix domain-containing protein [Flavobacterium urocaniciphilum]|uniref:Bacteriophage CI repressor helix-turn-helix domain-containing protein n=1 Tax=Flavobacterium urocaniciphilum TaxID=1299341 RepID=A0A1H9CRB5_9FLAO|nr:helix-turn-helix domain-containing protein [Flavobacterium urocaniciphilum]SEQ03168.1 Bacteriophage CI repressor helix-turn-helix domain-containing protein [Flavobacterium urocaniciphilum]
MQQKNAQNATNILIRLKNHLNINTDSSLSEFLNIKPNTISSWKKRNTLDYNKIIEKCLELNIDLNAIFNEEAESAQENSTPIISKDLIYQYTSGHLNDTLDRLPNMKLPFLENKESRVFQIDMSIIDPSSNKDCFAICEKTALVNINEEDIIIVISNKLGFFVTKIKRSSTDAAKTIITMADDSPFKNNFSISIKDIDEIWKVNGILSLV